MLITSASLIGTPILSVQASSKIAEISEPIIDPDTLTIIAFKVSGPLINKAYILDTKSVREYSQYGMVIDSIDDLAEPDDIIKVAKVLDLRFNLIDLKVETKKGTKLGKITDYTLTDNDFIIQQIIVKRPLVKSFIDPTLTIHRKEIVEVTDYKVIVKDEEKTIRARAEKEDFIPNFVNPFRGQDFAQSQTETPADKDTE